jgi:hypothetical protein
VERYVSGLSHHDRGGLVDEDESLGRAFGDRMRVVVDAIGRGQYATQLEWLLEVFAGERLLVLQYERCAADAAGQLARTYEFLGLPPHHLPPEELARPRNMAKLEKVAVPDEFLAMLRRYYEADVRRLLTLTDEIDPALWPSFRDLA